MTGACAHPNLTEELSLSPRTNTESDEGTNIILSDSSTVTLPSDDAHTKSGLSCRKRTSQIADIVKSGPSDDIYEISIKRHPTGKDSTWADIIISDRDTSDPLHDLKKARTGEQEKDDPTFSEVNSNESRVKMAKIPPASHPFNPTAMKQHIAKISSDALKKLPHRKGSKPVADFAEYLPNETSAMKLFEGIKPVCDTPQMTRWELSSNEDINSWLEKKDQYIHPVEAGEWFIDWFAVYNPLYAWAKFHSCEATFDKKNDRLTLTFKSELFATGKDEHGMFRSIQ